MRAGGYALSLLSVPLTVEVLTAFEPGPMTLGDLKRATGSPPQTTLRKQLRDLTRIGVLKRHRRSEFPGPVDYELGRAGRELLEVARVAVAWLGSAPGDAIELGGTVAKGALRALVDGWSSAIVRALAARPSSLTELDRLISALSYPSLERRLGAMRLTGQITACDRPGGGGRRPYEVTPWLRKAVAPLIAAAGWERRFEIAGAGPITPLDVESAFLLAMPLLRLGADLSGNARLVAELSGPEGRLALAGVVATVEDGRVCRCTTQLDERAEAWGSGSIDGWLTAILAGDREALELGGACDLAGALTDELHRSFRSARGLEV